MDWERIRAEFPALARWTYLNTATIGQMPRRGEEAVAAHFARRSGLAGTDFMDWFDDADRLRAAIARLVHGAPEDVAFVPNASTAFSLLLGGIDWQPGDRIVTLAGEFPNHYYYPSWLAQRGVEFVETEYARLREAVTPRTRLAALSSVNYSTGFRAPLEEIGALLRAHGALLYVDATQSVGALEFDTARLRPDLLAVHGYKWLLSPTGAGFMYVSPSLRGRLAPGVMGWRSDRGWRDPERLRLGVPEFSDAAEKYEGGVLPFPALYALEAAVGMMLEIGPAAIERRVLELAQGARAVLRRAGAILLSDEAPHHDSQIVCGRFPAGDASAIARELKARHVLVAARQGNLRVSPHFYNNEADLERLGETLRELGFRARSSVQIPSGSSPHAG